MRFAERFLVAFALISLIMRFCGLKDGPTLELIAMPLLAMFYLVATPFLLHVPLRARPVAKLMWLRLLGAILSGGALAYCIISFMLYTLSWLPKADMLENCCILLGLLTISGIVSWRRKLGPDYTGPGMRAAILLSAILVISMIPLPHIGSLSRGTFQKRAILPGLVSERPFGIAVSTVAERCDFIRQIFEKAA